MARRRTWTDDDLIAALDGARSWTEVKRRLGLRGGGGADALRRRCEELGVDASRLPRPGGSSRSWSDDDLRAAVARARNLAQVFAILDLAVGGQVWRRMQEHIVRLGLSTDHWDPHAVRPGQVPRRRIEIDDDELRETLPLVRSRAELARRLGLNPSNGSVQRRLRQRIEELGLPTEHLRGQAWARGRPTRSVRRRPLEEILVRDSPYRGATSSLRERLIAGGLLARRCAGCGITEWQGRSAPLQLDHVDGDPTNNLLANLRLLCPNCHALTATYCGRNIGRR